MIKLIIIILMIPMWLIGTFIFIQVLRAPKSPADKSNRINTIRLIWFAATRQDLFVDTFTWMRNDEFDNMNKKG